MSIWQSLYISYFTDFDNKRKVDTMTSNVRLLAERCVKIYTSYSTSYSRKPVMTYIFLHSHGIHLNILETKGYLLRDRQVSPFWKAVITTHHITCSHATCCIGCHATCTIHHSMLHRMSNTCLARTNKPQTLLFCVFNPIMKLFYA